jgi:hypothetical protein
MMELVIVTLSLITVIGTLSVALPLIYAQTNEGEGQIAEFNETQEETFSLITLNGEQIKEIRSNLNSTPSGNRERQHYRGTRQFDHN